MWSFTEARLQNFKHLFTLDEFFAFLVILGFKSEQYFCLTACIHGVNISSNVAANFPKLPSGGGEQSLIFEW